MITCRFDGRLGNNLFQMATAMSIAMDQGEDYGFDLGYIHTYRKRGFLDLIPPTNPGYQPTFNYMEPRFRYSPIRPVSGMSLSGWFQSEQYFLHHRKEILKLFGFPQGPVYKNVVGVHVRRGDYLNLSDHFPFVGLDYLNRAMDKFPGYHFLVFSDDIAWCMRNLTSGSVMFSKGSPNEDIIKMSLCQHQIISNSSFSWWAAWANRNPDKHIIAPKVWFGPKSKLDSTDIIPKTWEKL